MLSRCVSGHVVRESFWGLYRQTRGSETFCITWGGAFGSVRAVNNFSALMKDVQQSWRVQNRAFLFYVRFHCWKSFGLSFSKTRFHHIKVLLHLFYYYSDVKIVPYNYRGQWSCSTVACWWESSSKANEMNCGQKECVLSLFFCPFQFSFPVWL